MTIDEIIHMSYGCGIENSGNVLSWLELQGRLKEKFHTKNSSTCIKHIGKF